MHRPRFAYACRRRRHSLGPETRNPNAHYCTLSGRNDRRPTHVFKMLADSIVIANGSTVKARVALRNLLSESAVQQWNENACGLHVRTYMHTSASCSSLSCAGPSRCVQSYITDLVFSQLLRFMCFLVGANPDTRRSCSQSQARIRTYSDTNRFATFGAEHY